MINTKAPEDASEKDKRKQYAKGTRTKTKEQTQLRSNNIVHKFFVMFVFGIPIVTSQVLHVVVFIFGNTSRRRSIMSFACWCRSLPTPPNLVIAKGYSY